MSSISVLMSVYMSDKPAFFNRALHSVWTDQTLKPNEIILVEDGPLSSELYSIVEKWERALGKRLIVLKNEQNLGLTKSLNKGIKFATGDYIARMDSDDISMPDRFSLQSKFMDDNPEISVVGGSMQEIDENDSFGAVRIYPDSVKRIREYIAKANPIAHPTVFFRKSLFEKGFKYDERYRKNQDLKLWFDLLENGIVLYNIKDVVLKFRRTSDTYLKRSSYISLKSELEIYERGIEALYGKFSIKRIYPIVRFIVKSMPPSVNKFVYKYLFKKKN